MAGRFSSRIRRCISVRTPSSWRISWLERSAAAKLLGHEPRVALLSHSTFGDPAHDRVAPMLDAVKILDSRHVDFEYDGEMSPDVALEPSIRALYPFCLLTGDANVRWRCSGSCIPRTSTLSLMHHLGGGTRMTIGPLLIGMERPVQIAKPMDVLGQSGSSTSPASPLIQAVARQV